MITPSSDSLLPSPPDRSEYQRRCEEALKIARGTIMPMKAEARIQLDRYERALYAIIQSLEDR